MSQSARQIILRECTIYIGRQAIAVQEPNVATKLWQHVRANDPKLQDICVPIHLSSPDRDGGKKHWCWLWQIHPDLHVSGPRERVEDYPMPCAFLPWALSARLESGQVESYTRIANFVSNAAKRLGLEHPMQSSILDDALDVGVAIYTGVLSETPKRLGPKDRRLEAMYKTNGIIKTTLDIVG